jgi:hypothetical protein
VAAVGVMVGDHHITQDLEDMVAGHGSVRNMTGEALIPSSALSFVIGNPSLPNRTDLSGMCSSQDSFPPLFCGP